MRNLTCPGNLVCYLKYGSIIIAITLVVNLCYDSNETTLARLTSQTLNQSSGITDARFLNTLNIFINKTSELHNQKSHEFNDLFNKALADHEHRASISNNKMMSKIQSTVDALEKQVKELTETVVRRHSLAQINDGYTYKKYTLYRFVWVTTLSHNDGFADEAIDFLIPLCQKYPMFGWVDEVDNWVEKVKGRSEELMKLLKQCQEKGRDLLEVKAMPGIAILQFNPHQLEEIITDKFPQLQNFHYLIGRTMFETNGLPAGWADRINTYLNELWVPSEYHASVFKGWGVTVPVKAVGEGYDNHRFNPDTVGSAREELFPMCDKDDFIFLAISKWEDRKGYDHMLEAYRDAFTRNEKVCLAIRSDDLNRIKFDNPNYLNTNKVDRLSDEKYPMALKSADAYITASHGEGWGRPIIEAMAMGLPTIVPVWGGVTAYATDDIVIPIVVDDLEPAYPVNQDFLGGAFGHQWAKVLVPRIREAFRSVYHNQTGANLIGQAAREYVLKHFARDTIAERVLERTDDVFERRFNGIVPRVYPDKVVKQIKKRDASIIKTIEYDHSDKTKTQKQDDKTKTQKQDYEENVITQSTVNLKDRLVPPEKIKNPKEMEGPTVEVFHPAVEDGATGEPLINELVIEGVDVVDPRTKEVNINQPLKKIGYS